MAEFTGLSQIPVISFSIKRAMRGASSKTVIIGSNSERRSFWR
jgi:hypothetical protein